MRYEGYFVGCLGEVCQADRMAQNVNDLIDRVEPPEQHASRHLGRLRGREALQITQRISSIDRVVYASIKVVLEMLNDVASIAHSFQIGAAPDTENLS
jgi:hypothetical protein